MRALIALACSCAAGMAGAHDDGRTISGPDAWAAALLCAAIVLYGAGVLRLWHAAAPGRGVKTRQAVFFLAGALALAVALFSPLDSAADRSFSAHMVQHELLVLVAAPLLVLGRPLAVGAWGLRGATLAACAHVLQRPAVAMTWTFMTRPLTAWSVHAIALWLWHAPVLYAAAQADEWLHAAQHASFLFSALLFWWALLRDEWRSADRGAAVLYLFTTTLHTGILGALLVFSPVVWYPVNLEGASEWGWSSLEDQQVAGLIMWIPGGLIYTCIGLILFASLLTDRSSRRHHAS